MGTTPPLYIDYAWQHPAPAAIKADGYTGVLRYFSHDPSKDLTAAEAKALRAAGLVVGIVFETTAARATAGFAAGEADRAEAERRAAALGYPRNCPIFYAVDEGVGPDAVAEYFRGACSGNTYPIGVYGDIAVVDGMLAQGKAHYGWQTCAWSGGKVSQHAHLYQRQRHTRPAISGTGGSGYDEDVVLQALPLWGSVPAPRPTTHRASRTSFRLPLLPTNKGTGSFRRQHPTLRRGAKGVHVAHLQHLVGCNADGDFGPTTESHVRAAQRAHGLAVDGIAGPDTWAHLHPVLRMGARGHFVLELQRELGVAVDGVFGRKTRRALVRRQRALRVPADGVAGPQTYKAMIQR